MFTGIIKELGRVNRISGLGNNYKLYIEAKDISGETKIGDSVAVNGICLTLTGRDGKVMEFDILGETAKKTNISKLRPGQAVNLEGALKAGEPLGGHFVTGHIDCAGKIRRCGRAGGDYEVEVSFPRGYKKLVVEKGSISLDGISLTIGKVGVDSVTVYVIPHTLKKTTLESKAAGDEVNIEFDIIGKYAAGLAK